MKPELDQRIRNGESNLRIIYKYAGTKIIEIIQTGIVYPSRDHLAGTYVLFFCQYIQGITSNLSHIYAILPSLEYHVIAFAESLLNAGVFDSEIYDNSDNVFRSNRNLVGCGRSKGGGVFTLVRKTLKVFTILLLTI